MASSFAPLSSQTTLITIIAIFILSPFWSSATTATNGKQPSSFKKIYAFGDSYTDTGNTNSSSGTPNIFRYVSYLPYGITFFHHPTNRFSDGRLVIDFVAEALSLPYLPPYLNSEADACHGVNFAVAGSTAISYDFFVYNNLTLDTTPQSLQTQLTWFNKILEGQGCRGAMSQRECNAVFDDSLIWVGQIGFNDYGYTIGSSVSPISIQALVIESVTSFLQTLLTKGAKYVIVQGLPPIGCLPIFLIELSDADRDDIGCVGIVNKLIYLHNTILQIKLFELRVQFPQAVVVYADFWDVYHTIMKNAGNYGFEERYKVCCGSGGDPYNFDFSHPCASPNTTSCPDPSQYIVWDGVHITEAMQKVVSDMLLRGTSCHPPFDYLLSRKLQLG